MSVVDRSTLQRFVALAGERLKGDWVVIGGAVLPLLGVEHRITLDIDVAGPDEADMAQMLALIDIAETLGLPAAAVNQAGSHFLRLVEDWQAHLVVVHRGSSATLYVPDATLFLLLKLRRLSESDLLDAKVMIELAERRGDPIDADRVRRAASRAMEDAPSPERRARLEDLVRRLAGAS